MRSLQLETRLLLIAILALVLTSAGAVMRPTLASSPFVAPSNPLTTAHPFPTLTPTTTPTFTPTSTAASPTPGCNPYGYAPWNIVAPSLQSVAYPASASSSQYVYIAGGYTTSGLDTSQFSRYAPAANSWAALAPMSDVNYVISSLLPRRPIVRRLQPRFTLLAA